MRVSFVLPDLGLGGAQRVALILADAWQSAGWQVTLVSLSDQPPLFPLPPGVRWLPLPGAATGQGLRANLARVGLLRRALRDTRPDVAVSFITTANILTLLASVGQAWRRVVSERADPGVCPLPRHWALLRRATYWLADVVVAQTRTAAAVLRGFNRRTVIIPNPVPAVRPAATARTRTILAAGRLEWQKGFDLLIDAFARVAPDFTGWRLVIAGEGSLRADLQRRIEASGMMDRVHLAGFVADMMGLYQQASLFVLSSRFEGFPNVLCEAMAAGLPVIAADCPSGPGDIVRNNVDGLLVEPEDGEALAAALRRLLGSETERQRLAAEACKVVERFSSAAVVARWQELVLSVVSAR
jgi:glycosyltransferase involved in cell wall biosynthesis